MLFSVAHWLLVADGSRKVRHAVSTRWVARTRNVGRVPLRVQHYKHQLCFNIPPPYSTQYNSEHHQTPNTKHPFQNQTPRCREAPCFLPANPHILGDVLIKTDTHHVNQPRSKFQLHIQTIRAASNTEDTLVTRSEAKLFFLIYNVEFATILPAHITQHTQPQTPPPSPLRFRLLSLPPSALSLFLSRYSHSLVLFYFEY